MRKFIPKIKYFVCLLLCLGAFIAFMCLLFKKDESKIQDNSGMITVWQIDSFEGGRGSRADFLQKVGNDFTKSSGCYVNVISLSAEAARLNMSNKIFPDVVSYGAGTYGLESYVSSYTCWCRGGYCILTLDASSDFKDVSAQNTVINAGKDNLIGAAALFTGLNGAKTEKSTGAYVKLINGDFKYLLGTQRDVYRLKTREVSFAVKPVTEFNDLYQNISVVAGSKSVEQSESYIKYLMGRTDEVDRIGMLSDGVAYDDEMKNLLGLKYEYKLTAPVSADTAAKLKILISGGDINMLKTILK